MLTALRTGLKFLSPVGRFILTSLGVSEAMDRLFDDDPQAAGVIQKGFGAISIIGIVVVCFGGYFFIKDKFLKK